ncbi:MAG: Fpg/Nei family DNA glycosylase [Gammaproteobacteria bacterium]
MPEGHTVHRIARDHTAWLAGRCVQTASPQGRFAAEARRLCGRRLITVDAHGKHLFYEFDDESIVHVHLGLFGRFRVHRNAAPSPRDAVRLRLTGDERTIDLSGPTVCELTEPRALRSLFDRLGPDPLRADADPERAWAKITRSRAAIGSLLLNQAVIAGLGNIYRAEILHILAIHPDRPGNAITRAEFGQIWSLAVRLLEVGVKYNRIITADPQAIGKPYSRLNREERLLIYQRPECPRCGADVYCWEVGNRTVYACDACQV